MADAMGIVADLRRVPGIRDSAVALPVRLARAKAAAEGIAASRGMDEAGTVAYVAAHHAAGYGEVSMLLDDPKISNVMIKGRYVKAIGAPPKRRATTISLSGVSPAADIIDAIERDAAAASCGLGIDVSACGATAVVSRAPDRCTPLNLIASRYISKEELAYLWIAMESDANIAVVGEHAGIRKTMRAAASLLRPCDTAVAVSDGWENDWLPYGPRLTSCSSLEMGAEMDVDRVIVEQLNPKNASLLFRRAALGQPFIAGMKGDGNYSWIGGMAAKPYSVERAMLTKLGVVVNVGESIEGIAECRWPANCDAEKAEFASPDAPIMLQISKNGSLNAKAQRASAVMHNYSNKYAKTAGESFDELKKRAAFLSTCGSQNTDSYWALGFVHKV
ncbi:hypothetical protein M1589_04850 [Candidatus Marsarchaeota archaeon]|jgi:hypothetical protein|nr:hypothetical protein [Candidatus Marsarchaeota archaeon]